MECPHCHGSNDEDARYCNRCGRELERRCPACRRTNRVASRFCKACGAPLTSGDAAPPAAGPADDAPLPPAPPPVRGERKHVTVLFSDLTGFTSLSAGLDPEEVKDLLADLFGRIARVVVKYEGFIEKYVGDAVMAVFGATRAFEDDPLRAIRAAREIHHQVEELGARLRGRLERPLTMHSGIFSGLVVIGEVNPAQGTHGITGEPVNLAARLCGASRPGEILVGEDTFRQAQGSFDFEALAPVAVKGRAAPLPAWRVTGAKGQPRKVRRLHGRRAELVGRTAELARLSQAAEGLRRGQGAVVCIRGAAGTGKSRLIEEFRSRLPEGEIQWLEGQAYPYARNIPYYPLIDLLNLACRIEEGDDPDTVRARVEGRLGPLLKDTPDVLPSLGSLYTLHYDAPTGGSPENWKAQLYHAVKAVLGALALQAPTVVCFEDLHWADPSFVELLRAMIHEIPFPVLFLCSCRPSFQLLEGPADRPRPALVEIELADLSPDETLAMARALLQADTLPEALQKIILEQVGGNPFFLEEAINALVERRRLAQAGLAWRLQGALTAEDFSGTIHGVVAGRLDHLPPEAKRILQEAAVIGRVFQAEILKAVTSVPESLEASLHTLERLDMLRPRGDRADRIYDFKHAVVQEVVYGGILRKDRERIHAKIGRAMEQRFASRLSGYVETLAFHFALGGEGGKAVDYLVRSGEKSLRRCAVEEAHTHYQSAFALLAEKPARSPEEDRRLVDILIRWFFVYNARGLFTAMIDLLRAHEPLAEKIGDPSRLAMYCCCMGWALQRRESLVESHAYLLRALELARSCGDRRAEAYARGCLIWTCTDLGRLEEAVIHGREAAAVRQGLEPDAELLRINLTGLAVAHWFRGESRPCREIGRQLLAQGEAEGDIRSTSDGYLACAMGRFAAGDLPQTIDYCLKAVRASAGLVHSLNSKFLLGYTYLTAGRVADAEAILEEIVRFAARHGYEYLGSAAQALSALVGLAQGGVAAGVRVLRRHMEAFQVAGKRYHYLTFDYLLGKIYLQIALRQGAFRLPQMIRNLAFLAVALPTAGRQAERHLEQARTLAAEIGARGIAAQAHLDLALLWKARRSPARAREHGQASLRLWTECEADVHLAQARKLLEALPGDGPEAGD